MYEWEDGENFTAVDKFGNAVYSGNMADDDSGDSEYWNSKDY
jgi:hypothetical protein